MEIGNKNSFSHCPFCGSSLGYYEKLQVSGSTIYRYKFDGTEADNGDMYQYLNYKPSKFAYCLNCNKRIFKFED